jgi:hypothetical protein
MVGTIDRYVRITLPALQQIRLHHVISDLDPSIATPAMASDQVPTGYTEWAGEWDGTAVSLGWDWAVVHGAIVLINPMEIRTNLRILDGACDSPMRTRIHLQDWIEGLEWRAAIESILPQH